MKYYIIGIGGIGASYIARYLKVMGHNVSGCDAKQSTLTDELIQEGLIVSIGHPTENISEDIDMVLISPAILASPSDDYKKAQMLGLTIKTWQEELSALTRSKKTIAVCGAHGKSTTSAMLGYVLYELGADPTVFTGTKVPQFDGKNVRIGKGEILVLEADEFNENFLHYYPSMILCTSYEVDHLDYYEYEEKYRNAFVSFFKNMINNGKVMYHDQDIETKAIIHDAGKQGIGVDPSVHFELTLIGKHNQQNAGLVFQTCLELGYNETIIRSALQKFQGTWRRQEYLGMYKDVMVYDDYAHHPTEIKATLKAFRDAFPDKKITAIFQPHQYSRTLAFLDDFAQSFADCDTVLLMDIFASRDSEEIKKQISIEDVHSATSNHHQDVVLLKTKEEILKYCENNINDGIIITFGAGTVTEVGRELVNI